MDELPDLNFSRVTNTFMAAPTIEFTQYAMFRTANMETRTNEEFQLLQNVVIKGKNITNKEHTRRDAELNRMSSDSLKCMMNSEPHECHQAPAGCSPSSSLRESYQSRIGEWVKSATSENSSGQHRSSSYHHDEERSFHHDEESSYHPSSLKHHRDPKFFVKLPPINTGKSSPNYHATSRPYKNERTVYFDVPSSNYHERRKCVAEMNRDTSPGASSFRHYNEIPPSAEYIHSKHLSSSRYIEEDQPKRKVILVSSPPAPIHNSNFRDSKSSRRSHGYKSLSQSKYRRRGDRRRFC